MHNSKAVNNGLSSREDECGLVPEVSVVIPTYNRAYCLRRSIDSVLNQTFGALELIVVDDGSTDRTCELLREYSDPRLRIVRHETNRGGSAAINSGIRYARSDLIALQDSDDEWLPDKLAKQLEVMRRSDSSVGVVYCDQWRFRDGVKSYFPAPRITSEDGIIFEKALDDALYNIGNQSLLIRRTCFDRVGMFDQRLPKNVDLDMLIRISRHFKFEHIPEALLNYYVTSDSITSRGEAAGIRTQELMFEKFAEDLQEIPPLLAKRAYWIGSYHMRDGSVDKGREFLKRALVAQPLNFRYLIAVLIAQLGPTTYQRLHSVMK